MATVVGNSTGKTAEGTTLPVTRTAAFIVLIGLSTPVSAPLLHLGVRPAV
jgi:hypothetical protein